VNAPSIWSERYRYRVMLIRRRRRSQFNGSACRNGNRSSRGWLGNRVAAAVSPLGGEILLNSMSAESDSGGRGVTDERSQRMQHEPAGFARSRHPERQTCGARRRYTIRAGVCRWTPKQVFHSPTKACSKAATSTHAVSRLLFALCFLRAVSEKT
jgi:hypothetical protein